MKNIEQLYQDTILAHNRSPKSFGKMKEFSGTTIGRNPLCGDSYQLFVKIADERIEDISFWGEGCAISKASSSIMSDLVKGQTLACATEIKDAFLQLLLAENDEQQEAALAKLPRKLQVFQGVSGYPMRVKCATLIWRALEALLKEEGLSGPSDSGSEASKLGQQESGIEVQSL